MKRQKKQLSSCLLTMALAATSVLAPESASLDIVKALKDAPTVKAASDADASAASTVSSTATAALRRVSVHDPSVAVSKEGIYYVFGSHIEAAKSTDLMNWDRFTNGYTTPNNALFGNLSENLKKAFAWAGENDVDSAGGFSVWAPDVFWNKDYVNADGSTGAYMIYFCTTSTYKRSVIAYGVSQNIEGPYTFVNTVVYSGFTKETAYDANSKIDTKYTNTNINELINNGTLKDGVNSSWFSNAGGYNTSYSPNAIDPTVFYDKDGNLWMTYGSWSGGCFVLQIDPKTGAAIYPGTSSTKNGLTVDSYFGTRIAGGFGKSGEGPYIVYDKDSDYYYLYVTYEGLAENGGYNMRLFRSKNPDGPYTDAAGNNAVIPTDTTNHNNIGIKVMGNYQFSYFEKAYKSPGHNSALVDEKDNQRYLFYHTRFNGSEMHQVRVHQQFLNKEGWPVTAVFENKGDKISATGYDTAEIVGSYEFINHGTQSDLGNVIKSQKINLNLDGTITGDVKGTWTAESGTCYMSVVMDGVTYSGVFFKQHDESSNNNNVMTFTAIGTNNKTIWGVEAGVGVSLSKSVIYSGGDKNKTAKITLTNTPTDAVIEYTSSDSSVASVNASGKITAKGEGFALINVKITANGAVQTFEKEIEVREAYLKFSKKKTSLKKKKTFTYKVKGYGLKANSIKWKSSKPNVVAINKKTGKATAKKAGKAKITASYKKFKVSTNVKVKK